MKVTMPLRATAAAAVLGLTLAACGGGGGSDDESSSTSDEPTGQPGGEYNAYMSEPTFLAPSSKCYESECSKVLDMVNDPLVTTDFKTGELVYDGLAENIESEDNVTWTVTLKEGRTFHNGEPVDAEAFERAWTWTSDPKNAAETAGFMSHIEGAGEGKTLKGFKVVDDTTFEVTLSGPFSQFGQQMSYAPAFVPIAQACLDDIKGCNEEPIGTGPYMMDGAWQHNKGITVSKWDDYAGDQPVTADTVNFKMYTTPEAAFRDFQNGGLDVFDMAYAPDLYLEAQGQYGEFIEEPTSSLTYLGFPTTKAPFDNPQVRQAISMSIDRQQIVDQVLNGLYYPSTDIVTPPIPGSRDDACDYCTYDPEQAKQLLEEAGVDPEGETLTFYFNADAGHDQWVEAAARQVQDNLGFDYELEAQEWAQYLKFLDQKSFTGPFRLGWSLDYPSPENYIRPIVGTGGDSNYSGYSNSEVDDLLKQGDEAESLDEAIGFYQQADDVALEDMPIIPMWSGSTAIVHSDNVGDVRYDQGDGEIAFKEISVSQ